MRSPDATESAFSSTFFRERFLAERGIPSEKRWGREDIDPLASREPDREGWVGEDDGEVDYQ